MAASGTMGITRSLIRQHGVGHLFRGLSALVPAIGPAHALMFSGYEQVLSMGGAKDPNASPERVAVVGGAAGVISTLLHDSCMVPAETMKQRLHDAGHCGQQHSTLPDAVNVRVALSFYGLARNLNVTRASILVNLIEPLLHRRHS